MSKRTPEYTYMEVASVDMAVFIGWPTVRENNPSQDVTLGADGWFSWLESEL